MATEQTRRAERFLKRAVSAAAVAGVLAACEILPQGGYDIVSHRERESIPAVAAPAPPPVVAGIGGAAAEIPQLAAGAPAGVTQEMVEAGAQHFGTVCSACHGAGGQGSAAAPAVNDAQWIHISGAYEEIVTIIRSGVPNPREFAGAMPPMGGGNFNDQQLRELGAYVFALSHQGS